MIGPRAVEAGDSGVTVSFRVYGIPVPKARARTVKTKTGKTITYTPDKTADWENSVRAQALEHRPEKLLDGPLGVGLVFHLPRPKSAKKRRFPHTRPDLDNLTKAVLDALRGVIYLDDSRIVSKYTVKVYSDEPGVLVSIATMDDEEMAGEVGCRCLQESANA